jgi:hypothetical protein
MSAAVEPTDDVGAGSAEGSTSDRRRAPAHDRRGARQEMPSEVRASMTIFDRFAGQASAVVSWAPFFAFCVLLVVVWLPSFALFGSIDTWQLVINTITTIVTFLLVALLQNTQERTDAASQQKLNAIAQGLAELMEHVAGDDPGAPLREDICELRRAVGLEQREGS